MRIAGEQKSERPRFRWTLSEFSGSLGDLGIFIPIVIGLIAVNGMNPSQLLTTFGIFFIANGLVFGLPIPVEPMKAIAGISIANGYAPETIMLAGMIAGVVILIISLTGLLTRFQKLFPKAVVRGIQMGLGISLAAKGLTMISGTPILGFDSIGLAALSSILILVSFKKRFPAALILVIIGVAIALTGSPEVTESIRINLWTPALTLPLTANFALSLNLAFAQLPLTLTNSLIATYGLLHIKYRKKAPSIKTIGISVGVMSSIAPLIGGIGMCHGAGGVAAWHRFGARTAGSMLMFGAGLMMLGVFAGDFVTGVMQAFPLSILGTLLIFVAIELARQSKDAKRGGDIMVIAVTAMIGFTYSMLAGVLIGFALAYTLQIREKRLIR